MQSLKRNSNHAKKIIMKPRMKYHFPVQMPEIICTCGKFRNYWWPWYCRRKWCPQPIPLFPPHVQYPQWYMSHRI